MKSRSGQGRSGQGGSNPDRGIPPDTVRLPTAEPPDMQHQQNMYKEGNRAKKKPRGISQDTFVYKYHQL